RLAHRITVLHRGAVIADDTPTVVKANARVQEAYLGGIEGCSPSLVSIRTTEQATSCTASISICPGDAVVESLVPTASARRRPASPSWDWCHRAGAGWYSMAGPSRAGRRTGLRAPAWPTCPRVA